MNGIIWLASYPKSGNTWFRTFLSNLLKEEDEEVGINHIKTDGIFSARHILDHLSGIESSNLTHDEIDRLRPIAYNHLAASTKKQLYIKVHDAYTYLEDGAPLLGTVNAKALYFIRNPLDVAVSFANHLATDIDHTIRLMGGEGYSMCNSRGRVVNQFRQKLITWSGHAVSWTQARELPVHLIRYEDMKQKPLETFTAAVRFIGLDCTTEQISQALAESDFKKLKSQEQEQGFKEKPYNVTSFFRSGQVGDWRNHLTKEQIDQVIAEHGAVMRQFGYLDDKGNPIY